MTVTDTTGNKYTTSEFSNCLNTVQPLAVDLFVDKSDGSDTVRVDSMVRYDITVANLGSDTATGVKLLDSIPISLTYLSDSSNHGPCTVVGGVLSCDLGTLLPGEQANIVLLVSADSTGWVVNRALASANEADANPANDTGTDSTFVWDGTVAIGNEGEMLPETFELLASYPNPFNTSVVIPYRLPSASNVRLTIYNILGQTVKTLTSGVQPAGGHQQVWNGRDRSGRPVASGVYLYRLEAEAFTAVRKMILLK